MVSSGWKGKLCDYEVECRPFFNQDVVMRLPPQISLYQDPLLYYIYCRPAQEELFCNHSVYVYPHGAR